LIELQVADGTRRHRLRCQAVLFDMDGTLVDSKACVEQVWQAWAARHGLEVEGFMRIAHGRTNEEVMRLVAPHLDTPEEHAFLVQAEEGCREGITAVAGARELLALLPPDRWAVVTSAWRRLAEIRMQCAGLPLPAVLVTADQVPRSKPHPDGYLAAAGRLGVEPSACVVIEDAPAGIEAGRAAGAAVIGITTTFPREQLGCEWCIGDLRSLEVAPFSRR
jgi:sugar-phosphatase